MRDAGFAPSPCRLGARKGTRGATTLESSSERKDQRGEPIFRAHIDFQALKANLPRHIQNVKDRNSNAKPEKVVELYDQWVHLLGDVERLRAERNANAKSMKARPTACLYNVQCLACPPLLSTCDVQTACSGKVGDICQG